MVKYKSMSNTSDPTVIVKNLRWHILDLETGKYRYRAVRPKSDSKLWVSSRYKIYDNLNQTFVN